MYQKKILFQHIFILIVVSAASLSLSACGKLMDYGSSNSNSNTNVKQASSPAVADKANTAASPATEPVPAGPVLASTDGDKPGIRVEVVELKRTSGDTVNLKFTMVNDSDKDMSFGYDFGEGSTSDINTVAGAHLIDAAGKKKYFVVRDTENACLCSRGLDGIKQKSRANLYAKFPAPPDDVQKITVVIPHFTPMDDVPISR